MYIHTFDASAECVCRSGSIKQTPTAAALTDKKKRLLASRSLKPRKEKETERQMRGDKVIMFSQGQPSPSLPPSLPPPWARSNSTRRREPIQNLERKKNVLSRNPRQEGPLSVIRKRYFFLSLFRLSSDPRAYIYSVLRTVHDYSSHPSLYPSTLHIYPTLPTSRATTQPIVACLPPYDHHAALYGAIRPNSCTLPDNRASDREMRLPGSENPGNAWAAATKGAPDSRPG